MREMEVANSQDVFGLKRKLKEGKEVLQQDKARD